MKNVTNFKLPDYCLSEMIKVAMATIYNNIRIPDDLLAQLEAQAAPRGLTVDELAEATLRDSLREQAWRAKLDRWSQYGKASGATADQVPEIVSRWRIEQHNK